VLRGEPYYGLGDMAVSWHADDGLLEGSAIAVYNAMPAPHNIGDAAEEKHDDVPWRVGLKVAWDVETPAVPPSI